MSDKLKRYHFDCGNSNDGPVGFCAAVHATSKAEAVRLLLASLPEAEEVEPSHDGESVDDLLKPGPRVEYIQVYFGPVTAADIDSVDDLE